MSLRGKGHGSRVKELVYLVCFIFLLAPCPLSLAPVAFAQQNSLTVAAASDLSFALKEIAGKFEKDTGIKVILSFGSTGILSHQIENGAPFDIFFAANLKYIDAMKQKGLIVPDTSRVYAQGRIVLAMNKKFGGGIKRLEDLASPSVRRIAIANPDHAPYRSDTSRVYAQGRIVLAMNKKFGGGIKRLEDLASPSVRRIAIANPDHAPYGIA